MGAADTHGGDGGVTSDDADDPLRSGLTRRTFIGGAAGASTIGLAACENRSDSSPTTDVPTSLVELSCAHLDGGPS